MKYIIIPGLGDSGSEHWQSYWQNLFPSSERVIQKDWNNPKLEDWIFELQNLIQNISEPMILIAHSLGVALVVHWANLHKNPNVKGAFLVSPSDVESPSHTPESSRGFSPFPKIKLPFPSLIVASADDPYVPIQRAESLADLWDSDFRNVGRLGHINSESKLEYWELGQHLLKKFELEIKS